MKRLSWIESILLPWAMAALNVCWLTLWQRWIMAAGNIAGQPAVSPGVMLLTLAAGAYVTRYAVASASDNVHLQRAQRIVAFGGLAVVAAVLWITFGARFPLQFFHNLTEWRLGLSAEALAFMVAVLGWWRSIRIGRSDDLHESAQREFFGGITALVVLFALNKLRPSLSTADAFWSTMTFFAIGLGAMALAGLEQDRRLQKASTGAGLGVNRHWLATVGGIIGLILIGGAMAAVAADPQTLAAVDAWLEAIGVVIITGIGLVVIVLVWLAFPIAEALARVLWALLQRVLLWLPASMPFTLRPPEFEELVATAQALARTPSFRALEVVLLTLLVAFVFILAVRRFRLPGSQAEVEEIRESILSRDLLWKQLLSLLARRKAEAGIAPLPFLALDGAEGDPRLRVRRAYQHMLEWAQPRHGPRAPAQTPLAYARALGSAAPQAQESIAALTDAYLRARYGLEVSAEDARRAAAVVQELKQMTTSTTRSH